MCSSLYPGSHTLCSPSGAFSGILSNLTHNLSHALIARLLHRRQSIIIHLLFRHNIIFYYSTLKLHKLYHISNLQKEIV